MSKTDKITRVLMLYDQLRRGEQVNKAAFTTEHQITERSFDRDIEDIRLFLSDVYCGKELIFDRKAASYSIIESESSSISESEALVLSKILLSSRALCKQELFPILDKIIQNGVPKKKIQSVTNMIANEKYYYIELQHKQLLIDRIWKLNGAILEQKLIQVEYCRPKDKAIVTRLLKPVGIMFSEFYFYLTAFIENIDKESEFDNKDDIFPTIYRVDRFQSIEISDKQFVVPYKDRFQEGEFRKRIQFMYGGTLQKIKFIYSGPSLEAILDKLPTAQVIEQDEHGYTIVAEVFGKGVDMWLKSQGDYIQRIE